MRSRRPDTTQQPTVSRTQFLTSKISHICQEICDIKSRRRPQTNIAIQNYTNTGLVEEQTNQNYTREPDSSNSAKEGSDGVDGLCQGCSLRLTGTRGLVGEGGVEGVLDAFGS